MFKKMKMGRKGALDYLKQGPSRQSQTTAPDSRAPDQNNKSVYYDKIGKVLPETYLDNKHV